MNDKIFRNYKMKTNIKEDYSDNLGAEDDEFTDETITSDDIRMIGSNKIGNQNAYGNFPRSPQENQPKISDVQGSKYDVNNPSYRISGGFNSINKLSTSVIDNKGSSMYGGIMSNNKGYDPYSNININNNYSSAGFKSDRDKYNIDIDIKKYDKDKDKNDLFSKPNDSKDCKNKDTNFNYNYNLNNYNSNLNYSNPILKKENEKLKSHEIKAFSETANNKKKKKDFFDDLDNQLKKDKLNDEYEDEFGTQLLDRENDHINIKSGEDDSDDFKEITNINKELESMSNSKDINEASLKNKSKCYNEKMSLENRSKDSSINENLNNIKIIQTKTVFEKNKIKHENDKFYNQNNNINKKFDNFSDEDNNDNKYEDINSYKESKNSASYDEINIKKKSKNIETNEDYNDSTISINEYLEDDKKDIYEKKEDINPLNKKKMIEKIQEKNSNDISNMNNKGSYEIENIENSIKIESKKILDNDFDKFTISQSREINDKNKTEKNCYVYDAKKMEEYLKKSHGLKNEYQLNINEPDESKDNKLNQLNHNIKNKNNPIEKSYNYSQDLFVSQEKLSEKNKDCEIESEYNHYDEFDSNVYSINNDSSPHKIESSISNTNRDLFKDLNNSLGKNFKEEKKINCDKNYFKNEKNKEKKKESISINNKNIKNTKNSFDQLNYNEISNNQNVLNNNRLNKNIEICDINKIIEEKSEKSSNILDSKENDNENNFVIRANNSTKNSQNIKNKENQIRDLIVKEINKYVKENQIKEENFKNNQIILENKNNDSNENKDNSNCVKAKSEILNKLYLIEKTNNFLLNNDSSIIKLGQKKIKFLKLSTNQVNDFTLYGNGLSRRDIREMKLETALNEERKKREFFEFNYNKEKELIDELENKIRKLKAVEIENSEFKKLNIELENRYSELEKDLKNIKNDYDYKMKLIEDRVTNRENKKETRKITDLNNKFEIELDNLKLKLKENDTEINYLKEKCELIEKENNKLNTNKITMMETNEKFLELQNENFIIHEKLNERKNECNLLSISNEKLKKKIEEYEMELIRKQIMNEDSNYGKESKDNKEKINNYKDTSNSKNFTSNQENFKSDSLQYYNLNLFEKIYCERDYNTQEILLQSYLKEIKNLNNEIKLLKHINNVKKYSVSGFNFNPINEQSINISDNEENNYSLNNKNSEEGKIKKNNFVNEKKNSNIQIQKKLKSENKLFNNNSVLKQCAEEKLKKLVTLLNEKKNSILENDITADGMKILTNEIKLRDKNKTGDLDLETYLSILLDTLKIELNKYDLIEIFNNFYKSGPNKIKSSDLINALVNNEPSAFFIQCDPGYLIQIEKKIIEYENINNEKQSLINELNTKLKKYQEKIINFEEENKDFKEKNIILEKEKHANQLVFNEIMKNNFMRNPNNLNMGSFDNFNSSNRLIENNISSKDQINNKEIKELKDKIKDLEDNYKLSLKEFDSKIYEYESKLNGIRIILENDSKEEIKKLKELNKNLSNENSEIKIKIIELDSFSKKKIEKANEEIKKLKKIISFGDEKLNKFEKEKEKLIALLNKKNINTNFINNYLSAEELEILENKIADLEKRNKSRDEHYRVLCQTANTQQVNREIENLTKKFDVERKEFMRQINLKNSELIIIKKEFENIFGELEDIKLLKKK